MINVLLVKYSEHKDEAHEWNLDALELQDRNLIAGKNVPDKSTHLTLIHDLEQYKKNYEHIQKLRGKVFFSINTEDLREE